LSVKGDVSRKRTTATEQEKKTKKRNYKKDFMAVSQLNENSANEDKSERSSIIEEIMS
jgi:hypothetical protein